MQERAAIAWAREEFGDANFGDLRITARLVRTSSGALKRPSPTIAGTFGRTAEAEGAFRLVENDRVLLDELATASHRAAARRSASWSSVIVPIDSTSIRVRDPRDLRGLGPLSSLTDKARGIQAFHAIAVAPTGATLGVIGRDFWLRSRLATSSSEFKAANPLAVPESYRWVTMLRSVTEQMRQQAPNCTPWFQLDRGGDCWMVIEHAVRHGLMLTVRANQNRVLDRENNERSHLFSAIRAQPVLGELQVEVPRGRGREARRACLVLRSVRVAIPIPNLHKRRRVREIGVVMATEKDVPTDGSPKIEWILLTTREVRDADDAAEVIRAYTRRWRIEEFHRTWKSGVCGIESTRLRACDHIQRWAIIMGSVAARIEHIKYTSRTEPDVPANALFSRDEIDATILLTSEHRQIPFTSGQTPTAAQVTRWIADLGGYMGSKNSPPPGATVIGRGLERIESAAKILAIQRQTAKSSARKRM